MNRLLHLERTFIQNIEDNIDYPSLEFNLLDYNSTDGLGDWARTGLRKYLDAGILKYYHTGEPLFFDRSHSRNMIFRLSTGDIVCNLDADNYTGKNFAFFLNRVFQENTRDCIITPERVIRNEEDRNTYGRICIPRPLFLRVNGFDEKMRGYGFEDTDLIYRVKRQGAEEKFIMEKDFLGSISHSHELRVKEDELSKRLDTVLIAYRSHYCSRVIFLLNNGHYESAVFIDMTIVRCLDNIPEDIDITPGTEEYELAVLEEQWEEGVWQHIGAKLILTATDRLELHQTPFQDETAFASPDGQFFLTVTDRTLIDQLKYVYLQIKNRNRMDANLMGKNQVNPSGFGIGRVELNFSGELIELH